jgi:hypothetical protein
VAEIAQELADARQQVAEGLAQESVVIRRIHERYTHRMHDLSEFMKTLIQRFTLWFNRSQKRSGNLWEDAFKSVVVEDGVAARTVAAYIDLNPVRAGICEDPATYRWSGYGEAMASSGRGSGEKARAGLVRAWQAHQGTPADASLWNKPIAAAYRATLMEGATEKSTETVTPEGQTVNKVLRKGKKPSPDPALATDSSDPLALGLGPMLRCRLRYFSDGVVIGSRSFVNEFFQSTRDRFGPKRKDGARKLRGPASPAAGTLWSLRDLGTPKPFGSQSELPGES